MDSSQGLSVPPPPSYASLATPLQPNFSFASSSSGTSSHPAFSHSFAHLNLPSGFFVVRSRAPGQPVLDVKGKGNEACLQELKKPQLTRDNSLQNSANSQLWFLGWDGYLRSPSSAESVLDVVDNVVQLARPQPIFEIPSRDSHPFPRFSLDPHTSTLHVQFTCDPAFPGPYSEDGDRWMSTDYIVESVPLRRRREDSTPSPFATALLSGISETFGQLGFFGRTPLSPGPVPPSATLQPLPSTASERIRPPWETASSPNARTVFELPAIPLPAPSSSRPPASPLAPQPAPAFHRAEPHSDSDSDSDSDSEPSAARSLRVVALSRDWRTKYPAELLSRVSASSPSHTYGLAPARAKELRKWRRRQWDVVPVQVRRVEPAAPLLPALASLPGTPPHRPLLRAGGTRAAAPSPLRLPPPVGHRAPVREVDDPPSWVRLASPRAPSESAREEERQHEHEHEDEDDEVARVLFEVTTPVTGDSDAFPLGDAEVLRLAHQEQEEHDRESREGKGKMPGEINDSPVGGKRFLPKAQDAPASVGLLDEKTRKRLFALAVGAGTPGEDEQDDQDEHDERDEQDEQDEAEVATSGKRVPMLA